MAKAVLRLVGGLDFDPRNPLPPARSGANRAGWPLSPELLAALLKATPKEKRQVENLARNQLDMPLIYKRPEQ